MRPSRNGRKIKVAEALPHGVRVPVGYLEEIQACTTHRAKVSRGQEGEHVQARICWGLNERGGTDLGCRSLVWKRGINGSGHAIMLTACIEVVVGGFELSEEMLTYRSQT